LIKAVSKPLTFGVPSAEALDRIANANLVAAAQTAHYRFDARYREVHAQYEAAVAKLRAEYLDELAAIQQEAAE
jgi:hypothetical protein